MPSTSTPYIVRGDFNVTLHEDEKLGGLKFEQQEVIDFAFFINNYSLSKVKFLGSSFTWWNGRIERDCIFKRLDRILVNHSFLDIFPSSEVQHLARDKFYHAPLLLSCNTDEEVVIKPFRFLNFWTKNNKFKDIVRQNWAVAFEGSPLVAIKTKLK